MSKFKKIEPPAAKQEPKVLIAHDDTRIDPFFWLNNRENPEVIAYLEEENHYLKSVLDHTKPLQDSLFNEMKSRIKEDDESVPYCYQGYQYRTRFVKGQEYPIYERFEIRVNSDYRLLFDVNKMAEGFDYYQFGGMSISPNNALSSYAVDTVSRRIYTIYFKSLIEEAQLNDKLENTTGGLAWANDNTTVFYTRKNESLRAYQVWKHKLGTAQQDDELVYEEDDETFNCYVMATKSKKFIVIGASSTVSDEYYLIDADSPDTAARLFSPRRRGLEYSLSHFDDHFYIVTNKDQATNFKVMKTLDSATDEAHWIDVIAHRESTFLEGIELFNDFIVIEERTNGLNEIRIKRWDDTLDYYLPFSEETYTAYIGQNPDFHATSLRFSYQSLTTPNSVIEIEMNTKAQTVLKEQQVLDPNFDKDNYTGERLWATAADGSAIPISLVYKKGMTLNGSNPLLLYGYGSYGATIDPYFSSVRLSLLDRGFIYAIAHVRGGQYLGRSWYEQGKLLQKNNTFSDFIDCADFLIEQKYTAPQSLYAMGGSAGGLLMGVIINQRPELFNGVITAVPFVDIVTTMLDDSIPLTTGEYDEWGNPNDKQYYDYMLGYSPYDNVTPQAYPNLLVTSGLHDSQVQYWEPTKWVAKLRLNQLGDGMILLHTNIKAGHSGASGRFEPLKEVALEYAFLLDLEETRTTTHSN